MRTNTLRAAIGLATVIGIANTSSASDDRVFNGRYWVDMPEYSAADPHADLPSSFTLVGTARDFREASVTHGHADFELDPAGGYGHYQCGVQDDLGNDRKPVFRCTGRKVRQQATDAQGNPMIAAREYIASRPGDLPAVLAPEDGGAYTDAARLSQWYRNVPGVNSAAAFPITLVRTPGTDTYTFDDRDVAYFVDRGGFFILNDELYGNSAGEEKNFHFTYELDTQFVYHKGAGQMFSFRGDDDVWVFVDDKLVIDIGGIHTAVDQTIDMDRLEWLQDGKVYRLNFFFAERHRSLSNFRVETNLDLRVISMPDAGPLYD